MFPSIQHIQAQYEAIQALLQDFPDVSIASVSPWSLIMQCDSAISAHDLLIELGEHQATLNQGRLSDVFYITVVFNQG